MTGKKLYPLTWLMAGLVLVPNASGQTQVVVELGQNFTGSTFGIDSAFVPPDCNGAAGPDHFVELINGRFSVYAKTNGVRLLTKTSSDFWTAAGLSFPSGVIASDP